MKKNDQPDRLAAEAGKDAAAIRHDSGPTGNRAHGGPAGSLRDRVWAAWSGSSPLERGLMGVFLLLMIVFSAIPLTIDLLDMPNKDYSLWYQVGVALRQGMDIYPDPATGRLFPFMYPPSAAAILGFVEPAW